MRMILKEEDRDLVDVSEVKKLCYNTTETGPYVKPEHEKGEYFPVANIAMGVIDDFIQDMPPTLDTDPGDLNRIRGMLVSDLDFIIKGYMGRYNTAPTLYVAQKLLEMAFYREEEGERQLAQTMIHLSNELYKTSADWKRKHRRCV